MAKCTNEGTNTENLNDYDDYEPVPRRLLIAIHQPEGELH